MWQTSKQTKQRERKGDRQSLRCAVKRKIANNPSTENFPNLYPHRAVNRKNTVVY